jgi:HPt (histidine-containing phosphotransfer) domain-containing protein
MRSTEQRPADVIALDPEHRNAGLRAAYLARLAGDRERLVRLRRRFAGANLGGSALRSDVRQVAHAMAGAAAVFDAPPIERAARALEEAAMAAGRVPDAPANPALLDALETLMEVLLTWRRT